VLETNTWVQISTLARLRDNQVALFVRTSTDPEIRSKVARFLFDGTNHLEMGTQLIQAQGKLLEAIYGFGSKETLGFE